MFDNEQHHWIGVRPTPATQWGFIYCITHLPTGKKYIGKKAYRASVGPKPKMKPRSLKLPTFRDWHWKENNWRYYSGSSKHLTAFKKTTKPDEWEHEILTQCDNSMDLHYQEIEYLVWNRALTLVDEDGEYVFFNRSVPGIKFRPPETFSDESTAKMSESSRSPHYEKAKAAFDSGQTTFTRDVPCPRCGCTLFKLARHRTQRSGFTMACRDCNTEAQRKSRARKKEQST